MVLGKLDKYTQKMKLDHLLTPHSKINSKWIQGLNIRHQTKKSQKEILEVKSHDSAHSSILSHISLQARETKEKINKLYNIKLYNFFIAKETINKIKTQPTE